MSKKITYENLSEKAKFALLLLRRYGPCTSVSIRPHIEPVDIANLSNQLQRLCKYKMASCALGEDGKYYYAAIVDGEAPIKGRRKERATPIPESRGAPGLATCWQTVGGVYLGAAL